MLCAFQSEVAGTDHNRESALKIVLHVRIARAGPPLEHHIAEIEWGAAEIKGHDVVEFAFSLGSNPATPTALSRIFLPFRHRLRP